MRQLKEDHAVGTVVGLNDVKSEAKAAEKIGLKYIGRKIPMVPTTVVLESLSESIDREVNAGRKVYVHCHKGIYRAPTVAVAYLVYKGLKKDEAVKQVRDRRPTSLPEIEESQKLLPALRQFERRVRDGHKTPE